MPADVHFMRRCLVLAEHGRGLVGNGAMVGAVLVREGKIIAEAFHEGFGKPHAERALLESFEGEILPTDILYVNLEPCCHTGKTPPCTDIILERGVRNVVYGMKDPDVRVKGKGVAKLQGYKVQGTRMNIVGPLLLDECMRLNKGFVSVRENGRPWITLKRALTRDGKIANQDGSKMCITSDLQNKWSHNFLRARHDAILVGVQTVITDDPKLNTRFDHDFPYLFRLILDPHLKIPLTSQVVSDDRSNRTIIITAPDCDQKKEEELIKRGVRIMKIPTDRDHFVFPELWNSLITPKDDFYGITSILVEGGAKTWGEFVREGAVDEEVTLVGKT